ncbi:MAG: hypothetical protein PHC41_12685 [Lachnospiraceae bacterium]|nr:hypothetical protein [Lachnospiraceae bacterium]MDD3617063.1 hypothetical protein [Lachnospiraceae bacterium]
MRTQATKLETGKKQKIIIFSVFLLLVIAAILLLVVKVMPKSYTPPKFDETAVLGEPIPDAHFAYDEISVENGFSFFVAGNIYQQEDGSVYLYLTNPEGSDYILQGEILDESGEVLYSTGAIKSGSYVEKLKPLKEIENKAMKVEMRIYAFEKDTWYSRGTISLNNTLQPW